MSTSKKKERKLQSSKCFCMHLMKIFIGQLTQMADLSFVNRYIDPSYMIRSVPANATDTLYCMQLAVSFYLYSSL